MLKKTHSFVNISILSSNLHLDKILTILNTGKPLRISNLTKTGYIILVVGSEICVYPTAQKMYGKSSNNL